MRGWPQIMTRKVDRNGLQESLGDIPITHVTSNSGIIESKALPPTKNQWNTHSIPWRLTSDAAAAGCASGLVSPLIAIIDRYDSPRAPFHALTRQICIYLDTAILIRGSCRAIIENASGRVPLRTSLFSSFQSLVTQPHIFLTSRPFLLIYCLYFGTYAAANTVDTLSSIVHNKKPETTTAGPTKFLATTSVNMSLCLYKDSQYTRLFGPRISSALPRRPVPLTSYALFALRDSMTVFASFNVPPLIAPLLPLSESVEKQISRASAAQFLAPAGMQLLSTPLHLWGLDLYNRPGMSWSQRLGRVSRDWFGSSLARMARIVPAFGVGGVVNGGLRKTMMSRSERS